MKIPALLGLLALFASPVFGVVVFEKDSAYHHVMVLEEDGTRMLSFNGTRETKMSLTNPLTGHFEYTEYFHMPWLWNQNIKRVLMIGLGGGSTQRAYQHYYTNVVVDTVEIDPVVMDVAKKFFGVTETNGLRIHNMDGRVFLRRSTNEYDVILLDAYTWTRYGSSIPPHLVTKEFFTLARDHLSTNGVLAYNVIGQMQGWKQNIIGAVYRTLNDVFPRVYLFPANTSMNVVFIASKSSEAYNTARVQREALTLIRSGTVRMPTFQTRTRSFINIPPRSVATSPILTDDLAPLERLLQGEN